MKILHIIPNLKKGGAERLVLDICNELKKRNGVEVKLITFSTDNEYPFLTKDIDWEVKPSSVKLSILKKNKLNIIELQKAIEIFSPEIIHTHLYEAEIVSRSCYYPKASWFSHTHNNIEVFKKQKLIHLRNKKDIIQYYERKYLFKRYIKNGGTHFIAISKDTQKYYSQYALNFPITLLPNAINYKQFFNSTGNKLLDKIRLINIGSFQDIKNQKFLVQVAQNLEAQKIDFELHFLGEGKNKNNLQKKVSELDLDENVFFHGNVNFVEEYLWKSNIYVHSCFSEALGLTIIEAMAAGLPVVCLDGIGNRDLIEQGKNGYLFKEQNVERFTQKIIEIFNNSELYQKMSSFAIDFAKNFDINIYNEKLILLYNKSLS